VCTNASNQIRYYYKLIFSLITTFKLECSYIYYRFLLLKLRLNLLIGFLLLVIAGSYVKPFGHIISFIYSYLSIRLSRIKLSLFFGFFITIDFLNLCIFSFILQTCIYSLYFLVNSIFTTSTNS